MINTIKIISEKHGVLLSENFVDNTQFKIFLKSIHGALVLKEALSFFNGDTTLIHIPAKYLQDCYVITSSKEISVTEHVRSKIESLV